VSFVKSGKLRGLMVTDAMRWNAISDVANAKEAGLPAVQVIVTSFVATAIPGTSLRAE